MHTQDGHSEGLRSGRPVQYLNNMIHGQNLSSTSGEPELVEIPASAGRSNRAKTIGRLLHLNCKFFGLLYISVISAPGGGGGTINTLYAYIRDASTAVELLMSLDVFKI